MQFPSPPFYNGLHSSVSYDTPEWSHQELAEMSLLKESRGRTKGRTQAVGEGLTWSGVLGVCSGPGWGRTGRGIISPPPGYEGKQVWTLWFLQEGTWLGRARDSSSRETHWSFDLLSVQEAEGRNSMLFQSSTMSSQHPSPKRAERRGCSQVPDLL